MSWQTYVKAMMDRAGKEGSLKALKFIVETNPGNIAGYEKWAKEAYEKHQKKLKEGSDLALRKKKASDDLRAAQNAKTKDNKKIKDLQNQVAELDKQLQKVNPEISTLGREYQDVKKKLEDEKRKNIADVQKLAQAQSAYDAAVKKEDYERPWYVKAGNATINALESTITFGKKVFKMTDWDLMEKAVTAAGIALGKMKDPPEKLVKALDTTKKYLGYINLAISVDTTVDSLKELIAAAEHKTTVEIISEMVRERIAASA
jgi:chromosome segregation ATPase